MLKVEFRNIEYSPEIKIDLYSSINRIPFTIRIGDYKSLPTTVYSRNLNGENFIEFRFDQSNRNLYEVSLVAIQNNTVIDSHSDIIIGNDEFHICRLNYEESIFEDAVPMKIFRTENSLCVSFQNELTSSIKYYSIGKNCYVGVNEQFFLVSFFLNELSKKNIFDILGY